MSPSDELAVLDEILQVMYWLRGEGLADDVGARDLERWIGKEVQAIDPLLKRLAERGLIRPLNALPRYSLTEAGVREGGRRFADEFAELIRPGHGECGDPNCDCQKTGNPADCEHRHV